MEAPATTSTVEDMTAVTVEAGAGAAGGRATIVEAVTRAAGGDAMAAEVVAAGGDAGDAAGAAAMAAEVVVAVTEVVETGGDAVEDEVAAAQVADPDPEASPEEASIARQLRDLYAAFKGRLAAQDRQVLELRVEQQLPRARVSELTGLSAMQVRTREKKIRARLLAELEPQGEAAGLLLLLVLARLA